ncbi:MAG: hypothetical protein K940chlam1_01258, partial [Candidatus Anoxychlamydiales bacterium]|nr:hypothetical protein [Candidatus Anoxychlamydiales bacterium]NGX35312.1 hypothetical protein [Candidatus Anoxychlamydiales bacterium]
MKRISKLDEIAKALETIKNEKKINIKVIEKLKFDLDEEEKISRNYLQITLKTNLIKNKKRALSWTNKVIELKEKLNMLLKSYSSEKIFKSKRLYSDI